MIMWKLLNTISNSNAIILLSTRRLFGQSRCIFFKLPVNYSCPLCITVLDEMLLRLKNRLNNYHNFNEWELKKLLLNSGLSRSGTWSHLLFILGNALNCLYSWTNKTQITTSILGEKWEVIWEENELFVNYYILLDSELWLCKYFLHFLVLVRDCFLTPLSNNNKWNDLILVSYFGGDPVYPIPRRKQFQKYFPRKDMKKKIQCKVRCYKDITIENGHLSLTLLQCEAGHWLFRHIGVWRPLQNVN